MKKNVIEAAIDLTNEKGIRLNLAELKKVILVARDLPDDKKEMN